MAKYQYGIPRQEIKFWDSKTPKHFQNFALFLDMKVIIKFERKIEIKSDTIYHLESRSQMFKLHKSYIVGNAKDLNFWLFLALTLSLSTVFIIHTMSPGKANIIQMRLDEFYSVCVLNIVEKI